MKKTTELLEEPEGLIQARDLRHALGAFATGVVIVGTRDRAGQPVGVTVNSFSSLSLEPPLVLWSLNAQSPSRRSFEEADYFSVNVLSADQVALARRFGTRAAQKFLDVPTRQGLGGIPIFADSAAVFECRRVAQHAGGDHVIYVGQVEAYETYPERPPLLFHRGHYRHLGGPVD